MRQKPRLSNEALRLIAILEGKPPQDETKPKNKLGDKPKPCNNKGN